ncbi:MAG: NAD(P)-binding domain-containing protein [Porticoccaceae bacterium]|nr:NAD(P)-binding domain-containing protein [Porticoccaceae bacterium]
MNIFGELIDPTILVYVVPMMFIWAAYQVYQRCRHQAAAQKQKEAQNSGLAEPASLHPVIDPSSCLGCGACVHACPEGEILGLIHGKAVLVNPSSCIGHGACKTACPREAITLVFGTETRGVDIPVLKPNFETNVPGIFVAGELGGMGLIRNALTQGVQAADAIAKVAPKQPPAELDLMIVGAGPAGIAASLSAKANNLKFVTIDQDSVGGTVAHFPRNKIVMTAPVVLPIVGKIRFKETTKEALLEFWQRIITDTSLKINHNEQLEAVDRQAHTFILKTSRGEYSSRNLLLCLGRRGTPRKLGVDGEDLTKVVYRLIDSAQYRHQHVLVVGGGDSALEAAISIAEEPGTTVSLSYRGESFSRAKPKNREKLAAAVEKHDLKVMLNSTVSSIAKISVDIQHNSGIFTVKNNAVIVCVGGILPTPFLEKLGVSIESKYGTA